MQFIDWRKLSYSQVQWCRWHRRLNPNLRPNQRGCLLSHLHLVNHRAEPLALTSAEGQPRCLEGLFTNVLHLFGARHRGRKVKSNFGVGLGRGQARGRCASRAHDGAQPGAAMRAIAEAPPGRERDSRAAIEAQGCHSKGLPDGAG